MISLALSRGVSSIITLILVLAAPPVYAADSSQRVYVGTYTDKDSKGIYAFRFDPASGEAGPVELAAETPSPSFLVVDKGGRYLYAVNELPVFNGNMAGGVTVFAIDGTTGKLNQLQQVSSAGADPAHVSIDASGKFLLVANYSSGSVAVFPIGADGKLGERTSFFQNTGSSVNKERQSNPHAHEIAAVAGNQYVLVADLGTDELLAFKFDGATGSLTPAKPKGFKVTPGSGPRHFAVSPSGRYVYLVNEMANTVNVLWFDEKSGKMRLEQSIPTLPVGFGGANTTAEIAVDHAGKFLYVSNRGEESIAVFAIAADDGKLRLVDRTPTGGKQPRHFTFDPSGKWMLVENQESDNITVFAVDPATGKLTRWKTTLSVSSPVCLVFVP
jgi:6-phosphogluconolactonase